MPKEVQVGGVRMICRWAVFWLRQSIPFSPEAPAGIFIDLQQDVLQAPTRSRLRVDGDEHDEGEGQEQTEHQQHPPHGTAGIPRGDEADNRQQESHHSAVREPSDLAVQAIALCGELLASPVVDVGWSRICHSARRLGIKLPF